MRFMDAPPVYAPGGPVAFVERLSDEPHLGTLVAHAREQGAVLCIVACPAGSPDEEALRETGFTIASEWYLAMLPLSAPKPGILDVRPLRESDLDRVAELAEQRRQVYAAYQPVFWRVAPDAVSKHRPFLSTLLTRSDVYAFAHQDASGNVDGYVFADRRGIDDFAVAEPALWPTVGAALLHAATAQQTAEGVTECTVVCGHRDIAKRAMLAANGLALRSCWWVLPLADENAGRPA
jgi:uncharacterized protein YijF (DUF1287 family)